MAARASKFTSSRTMATPPWPSTPSRCCWQPAATSRAWIARCAPARWNPHEGVQLLGKTLGVIGLGGIGREVLRIGRGLGMEVIAWNRTPKPGAPLVPLDELLARSDVISINLTLNDETRGFLGPGAICAHEARRDFRQHRARRSGRRDSLHRSAALAAASAMPGSTCFMPSRCGAIPARKHGKRHAQRPRRLSHARSLDDAATARHRHRARYSEPAIHDGTSRPRFCC